MVDSRPQWLAALRKLAASAVPEDVRDNPPVVPTFGTVRSLDPLRIALDSDPATTIPYAPACLEYPTAVGQRIMAQSWGRQVVVLGILKSAPAWIPLYLVNGWHPYPESEWQPPQYRKDGNVVTLRGMMEHSTPSQLGQFAVLPPEARPPANLLWSQYANQGTARLSLYSQTGQLHVTEALGGAMPGVLTSLTGISFRTN